MKKKSRTVIKIFLPVMVLILIAAGIFFARSPVLIVSDHYFTELYGKNRTLFAQIRSSLSLFRQVKLVMIPEDIGPGGIVFAVSEVSENPFCVCFPYRYLDGAEHYQNQFSSIKVLLFAGKENPSEGNGQFRVIKTDTGNDLYRAGICAAIIAQNKEGKILCYIEKGGTAEEKTVFEQGLKDGGREESANSVLFINLNREYYDETEISCIVLTGNSADPFITEENIPIILSSWADPRFFSPQVKLILSDSLWETVVPAVKMTQSTENLIHLPSVIQFHAQNNFSREEKKRLKRAMELVSVPPKIESNAKQSLNKMMFSADTLTKGACSERRIFYSESFLSITQIKYR